MSTEIPQIETDAQETSVGEAEEQREKPRRRGSFAASVALLFSLAALAGTAWMWWQGQSTSVEGEERFFDEVARLERGDSDLAGELQRVRDELDALSPAEADDRARLAAIEDRLVADRAQLQRAEREIREQEALAQSLQANMDALHSRLRAAELALSTAATRESDAVGDLDLAEVDYLLRLASERLQLFADPAAADRALEVADRHLAAMDSPAYYGVRQEIAAARQALAAVDVPDYLEVAAELDAVQSAIPHLPFPGRESSGDIAVPTADDGWWARLKNVFASLVTVRRNADDGEARLSLEDEEYIRQRAWLQMEIARLALMRRDQGAFRGALARAQETLDTWFDPADSRVQSAAGRLAELAALEVEAALPDITAPWSALRRVRAVRSAPVPAAVPAPAPADSAAGGAATQPESADGPGESEEPATGAEVQDREDAG